MSTTHPTDEAYAAGFTLGKNAHRRALPGQTEEQAADASYVDAKRIAKSYDDTEAFMDGYSNARNRE